MHPLNSPQPTLCSTPDKAERLNRALDILIDYLLLAEDEKMTVPRHAQGTHSQQGQNRSQECAQPAIADGAIEEDATSATWGDARVNPLARLSRTSSRR
jgi:hypothetical protein